MQIVLSDDCVRASLTACSLTLASLHDGKEQANSWAWGKALNAIQSKIASTNLDAKELYELLVAVLFLGLIEVG